jgi:hypothetical protein
VLTVGAASIVFILAGVGLFISGNRFEEWLTSGPKKPVGNKAETQTQSTSPVSRPVPIAAPPSQQLKTTQQTTPTGKESVAIKPTEPDPCAQNSPQVKIGTLYAAHNGVGVKVRGCSKLDVGKATLIDNKGGGLIVGSPPNKANQGVTAGLPKEGPPITALLEDNQGTTFEHFTVRGNLVARKNKDSKFSDFSVDQTKPGAYTEWQKNITRDAGSRELIEKDFTELKSQLVGVLNNPLLTDEQKVKIKRNWDAIEQDFMAVADDRQKTLDLLAHIGFEP